MSKPFSIQRRMIIGLTIGIVVLWLTATIVATFVIRHELDEAFDSALQESSQRLLALAAIEVLSRDGSKGAARVATIVEHEEILTYRVRDGDGNILLRSHDAKFEDFPVQIFTGFRTTNTHRLYAESAISGSIYIEVAEQLEHRREAVSGAFFALLTPLLALIPLSILGVWWVVRRSMQSVIQLRSQIESRNEGDLMAISSDDLPSEISPIADAVNQLLGRLRHVLGAERNFSANSAHELRTPIAAALAQTQRLIATLPKGAPHDRARQIEASLHHLTRLSEKLLQMAKAEGGGVLSDIAQDLAPILPHIIQGFSHSKSDQGRLRLILPENPTLISRMDPDAFAILVSNLIENALKHSAPDTNVEIELDMGRTISVRNHGAVIPKEIIDSLKDRFQRANSEVIGSGLGLAIADTIAKRANGNLELCSPASILNDGFEAKLTLRI